MTELRQRVEPIRSNKIRNSAKGETCTLQIFGICNNDPSTTVLAHIHDETFGASQKADDCSAIYACSACHDEIDRRTRKLPVEKLTWYLLRALQRTIRRQIERGLIVYPITIETPASARPIKSRKPREERQRIPRSQNPWPQGRKIPTRQKEPTS